MARIYRKSDRIKVKIGDIEVKLSPLDNHQKMRVQQLILDGKSNEKSVEKVMEGTLLAIRFALKDITGLEDSDGQPYKLGFTEEGLVSEESMNDLMNIELGPTLLHVCNQMVNGIPKEFGIEGVEVIGVEKESAEKNVLK